MQPGLYNKDGDMENIMQAYNTAHNFQPGQRVTVNGIPGTVRAVCPTGALEIAIDHSTRNTYLEGVEPLTLEQELIIANEALCENARLSLAYSGVE